MGELAIYPPCLDVKPEVRQFHASIFPVVFEFFFVVKVWSCNDAIGSVPARLTARLTGGIELFILEDALNRDGERVSVRVSVTPVMPMSVNLWLTDHREAGEADALLQSGARLTQRQ